MADNYHLRFIDPPYYISAYGIAVKHGFTGSEAEWLESLRGPSGSIDIRAAYATEEDLFEAHPTGETGEYYLVGDSQTYLIYFWDGEAEEWKTLTIKGESAYETAQAGGYTGSEADFRDAMAQVNLYVTAAESARAAAQAAATAAGTAASEAQSAKSSAMVSAANAASYAGEMQSAVSAAQASATAAQTAANTITPVIPMVQALESLVSPDNNGKVVAIQRGTLAAVSVASLIPDGDEVYY